HRRRVNGRERMTSTRERSRFLAKFLGNVRQVSAVTPASRWLARSHAERVTPGAPQVIVEVGSGTGVVTEALAARMHPSSTLVAIELDGELARMTQDRVPLAHVLAADVSDIGAILAQLGCPRIDLLVCCLALPHLPRSTVETLFAALATLGRNAWYVQQTLVPLVYRRTYKRLFEEVHFRPVLRNLPPGGTYQCRGLRPDYVQHLPGRVEHA
ncbi:MAG: class I SAM-dependent methyltransferase, partial [Planctomycetota bacterium]